eukprot:tig00021167_g19058.t1
MTWFARYNKAEEVPDDLIRANAKLSGTCVHVHDGDTIRVWHEPTLRCGSMPRGRPLREVALSIRLAGIDAPEIGKDGRPSQPGAEASREWLREMLEGQKVTVVLHRRDQYGRLVGTVLVRKCLFKKNASVMSLRKGMSSIYKGGGAEYGGSLEEMERAQAKAKENRRGIWGDPSHQSPAEYKKKLREEQAAAGGRPPGGAGNRTGAAANAI